LANWLHNQKKTKSKIQKGEEVDRDLSQVRIERLEVIGLQWNIYDENFEEKCSDLTAFKEKEGHCKVPYRYAANPSLGYWCSKMRRAYNIIQKGMKPKNNLSEDRMKGLNEIELTDGLALLDGMSLTDGFALIEMV
jgi:hypothetical protein